MITATVALPVYNSKNIAWLAMESLCRQEGIKDNWELIVCEDGNNQIGSGFFESYKPRLEKIGLKKFTHIPITERIPLSYKWRIMGKATDLHSVSFIPIGADDYTHPQKIARAHAILSSGKYNWYHAKCAYLYSIPLNKVMLYDHHTLQNKGQGRASVYWAVQTQFARFLPKEIKWRGVDGWFLSKVRPLKTYTDTDPVWQYGCFTHGMNNISMGREKSFINPAPPFVVCNKSLHEIIPPDITARLLALRNENMEHYIKRIPTALLAHALMDYTLYLRGIDHLKPGTSGLREIIQKYIEDANNRYGYPGETVNIDGQCKCGCTQSYREMNNMKTSICPACLKEK